MFGEKVKELRLAKNLTQQELANMIGVTKRTLINYETGRSEPRQNSVILKLSEIFSISADSLLDNKDANTLLSEQAGRLDKDYDTSSKSKVEVKELLNQVQALFADEELNEQDKDAAMEIIMKAYWDSKRS